MLTRVTYNDPCLNELEVLMDTVYSLLEGLGDVDEEFCDLWGRKGDETPTLCQMGLALKIAYWMTNAQRAYKNSSWKANK